MIDLSTEYLGLTLPHPICASASPMSGTLAGIQRLARAGAAAVVLESLFEEYIEHEVEVTEGYLTEGTESYAEATSYFPNMELERWKPSEYCRLLERARRSVEIPIIASLNGATLGGWLHWATRLEDAGAHALELNLYQVPTDPHRTAHDLEDEILHIVSSLVAQLSIPVCVKLSPFYTSLPNFARRLVGAGARGLVLFNRFYQADLDIDRLEVVPRLELSRSQESLLPITWTAILYGHVECDLAVTSGIGSAGDILKATMAGAGPVFVASLFLRQGPELIPELLREMSDWLREREYTSLAQARGSMSRIHVDDPRAFERANYMKTLHSYRSWN